MKLIRLGLLGSALIQLACNAADGGNDAPGHRGSVSPPDGQPTEPTAPGAPRVPTRVTEPSAPIDPGFPQLPTDTRAPISAASAPPMISGGTLIVARDGYTAIAAVVSGSPALHCNGRSAGVMKYT